MPPVKKPAHNRLPTFLRQWRKFRKLTLEKVAERLEVDHSTVGRIERGELPYNQDILERLALIYGCEAADLLTNDPLRIDPPKLIYDRLKDATPELRAQALAVVEALLRAG